MWPNFSHTMEQLNHIAFIMDGNRRWAKKLGKQTMEGHGEGANKAREVVEWCVRRNIPHITLWALSTDNLKKRSIAELSYIFSLLAKIPEFFGDLKQHGISLDFFGDLEGLPEQIKKTVHSLQKTMHVPNARHHLHIALNYGGQREIVEAVNKLLTLKKDHISEEDITNNLSSGHIPPADLIVRTGGKRRLSGFLLWQSGYAELFFTNSYWPAFSEDDFEKALSFFLNTKRNFGA